MTFDDYLANVGPLAPIIFLAAGTAIWLRASRTAWIAAGLIAVMAPGVVLTWYLRDAGFHAYGGVCGGKVRGFMEAMQHVFLAQVLSGIVGAAILGSFAVRKSLVPGVIVLLLLAATALVTGFLIYFAAGMTAVDQYMCQEEHFDAAGLPP